MSKTLLNWRWWAAIPWAVIAMPFASISWFLWVLVLLTEKLPGIAHSYDQAIRAIFRAKDMQDWVREGGKDE